MSKRYSPRDKNRGEDQDGKATHSSDPRDYEIDDTMDFNIEDR